MKKQLFAAILTICSAMVLTSCSNDDDSAGQQSEYAGMPLIIYDTDIGSSTDDLFALEMLYRYEDEGRCRLLGIMAETIFTPSATGNVRYQLPGSEAWAAQMLEKIRTQKGRFLLCTR